MLFYRILWKKNLIVATRSILCTRTRVSFRVLDRKAMLIFQPNNCNSAEMFEALIFKCQLWKVSIRILQILCVIQKVHFYRRSDVIIVFLLIFVWLLIYFEPYFFQIWSRLILLNQNKTLCYTTHNKKKTLFKCLTLTTIDDTQIYWNFLNLLNEIDSPMSIIIKLLIWKVADEI